MSFRAHQALALSILAVASPRPAFAQRGGTVELVPLVRYAFYPESLSLRNAATFGGAAGLFLNRKLSLELEGTYGSTNQPDTATVAVATLAGRLMARLPLREHSVALLGLGYSRYWFDGGPDERAEGLDALLGFRFGFGPRLGLRLEGTADYLADAGSSQGSQWVIGAQVGMSIYAGPLGPRDTDRDGVANASDRCPETAPGDSVDPTGCALPRDSDGDGVLNGVDRCPSTPANQAVDLTGCNPDLDGDGVPNPVDRCPETAPRTQVDAFGCPAAAPAPDTDRDGVPDARDRCPGTVSGATVDALGCVVGYPAAIAPKPIPPRLVLRSVTFVSGSAVLSPQSSASLDSVAAAMRAEPTVRLEVAGYTDNTGSREGNEKLSLARAEAVQAYLIEAGVAADRIVSAGHGPDDPIASNATAAGRSANRRVELRRLGPSAR